MLSVAFLWHMHQPYYRDPLTGDYTLPWVRLHACKGYYDMASILDDYPFLRQTFNLVPSLLRQIEEYVQDQAKDVFWEHSRKPAADLTPAEKKFILANFFMGNWETMVKPYPAYWALLQKRGTQISPYRLEEIWPQFSTQDYRDLQVWFNLTWFGFRARAEKKELQELFYKARMFSEDDKLNLLKMQKDLIKEIIPLYRRLEEKGQIEITTSPFYHPILPLLIDWSFARRAMLEVSLPATFAHPEDAAAQISKAVDYYQRLFGHLPSGLWPPEGSVCPELIPLVKKAGIQWLASDEGILFKSLGKENPRHLLYYPYRVEFAGTEIYMVFRDRHLADLIGFTYAKNDPQVAAQDFVSHLQNIRRSLPEGYPLVCIALDGENAWEYYPDGGQEFLKRLYTYITQDATLEPVRLKDFLQAHPATATLPSLYTGSWINQNFKIWIGSAEDNQAWNNLRRTRIFLVENEQKIANHEVRQSAWEEIYIAEGSDWFWWYGDEFSSAHKEEFDRLFRAHLMQVHLLLNSPIPEYLRHPIILPREIKPPLEPIGLLKPTLDGRITHFYEWAEAGYYAAEPLRSSMFQGQMLINGFYYGFDLDNFYLRIDPAHLGMAAAAEMIVQIIFLHPREGRIEFPLVFRDKTKPFYHLLIKNEKGEEVKQISTQICAQQIIELAVPFALLGFRAQEKVSFCLQMQKDGLIWERYPHQGYLSFAVPDQDFLVSMWQV